MLPIRAETTVSTYGSVEIARLEKKKKKEEEQLGSFDKFQFGTSAMVASDFDGLGGYRTLAYEGQVPTKFSRLPFVFFYFLYIFFYNIYAIVQWLLLHMACLCHPYIQSLPTL